MLLALGGLAVALFGTFWDDAWHTEIGRDSFLIPPHVALYLGVSIAGAALSAWAATVVRREGLRAATRRPELALLGLGIVVTLGAAPIDNAWHAAFGRDAVLWSPPHMLGVAGSLAIASGLLLELGAAGPGRTSKAAAGVAAAAVLGVCVIPVLEYETDVPQFDSGYYLPVLATGAAYAFGAIRLVVGRSGSAFHAALFHGAAMLLITVALLLLGMPAPLLPLLIAPALAFDWIAKRRRSTPLRALVFVSAVYVVYVPYLEWATSGVHITAGQLLWSMPLGLVGAAAALWLTNEGKPGSPTKMALAGALLVLAAAFLQAPLASAHDPGQGRAFASASVSASASSRAGTIEVRVSPVRACGLVSPTATVARRAGVQADGPLRRVGRCEFTGTVALPERGRWFVYADFEYEGEKLETWLPVERGDPEPVRDVARTLYFVSSVDSPALKTAVGAAAYAILVGILIAIPAACRRSKPAGT